MTKDACGESCPIHRPFWQRAEPRGEVKRAERKIEVENRFGRDFGNYLLKALEIHRNYPDARFWFYVSML